MLTEMTKYRYKIQEEKMKAMPNEIKKNIQGTKSEGKETGTQIKFGTEGRNKYSARTE